MGTTVGGATKVGLALPGGSPLITASPDTLFSSSPTFVKGGSGIAVAPGATVADGVRYGGKATIPLTGGRSVAVNVAGRITPANLAKGVAAIAGGPLGVAAIIGVPLIIDWMESAGTRVNPDGSGFQQVDPTVCTVAPCYGYYVSGSYGFTSSMLFPTKEALCEAVRVASGASSYSVSGNVCYVPSGSCSRWCPVIQQTTVAPSPPTWTTATPEQLEAKLQTVAPAPGVVRELLDKGIAIPVESPSVTGPSTTPGPQSQTNRPDGKVVTQTTTHNHTYEGDTITTTITNITNVYDPTTDTTETTTEEKEPEDERQCKDGDQTVGCAEFGNPPTDEIPTATRSISFVPESLFGGGTCPTWPTWEDSLGSHELDLDGFCDLASNVIRPLLLAMAALAAVFIVIPARTES